jgi:anaphase-promoting complex subunit 2
MCGDIVVEVVQHKIAKHIESTSMDNYAVSFIGSFERWLDKIIIGWIKLIYVPSLQQKKQQQQQRLSTTTATRTTAMATAKSLSLAKFDDCLHNYKKQLAHYMYTYYASVRIKRLFDIVIDYPDSKSAVDDLKICLEKTNLRTAVISGLRSSIEQRLLHPGVNTSDILTAYVSAIKALLCLDSSGVMMENVCEPLKRYLRQRDDTVKCIVSNLTDDAESSNDLMEEFCKDLYATDDVDPNGIAAQESIQQQTQSQPQTQQQQMITSKPKAWELWMPEPVDAAHLIGVGGGEGSGAAKKSNIISMLVNIYGSKDMFVNEYKTLLADRLLSSYSYNMEKEIRNLELLKVRFGDSNLFACEAMIKDISESKRINANILEQLTRQAAAAATIGGANSDSETDATAGQATLADKLPFDISQQTLKCIILSEQFWPKLKEEKIEMPAEIRRIQEKFTASYEAFKGNRTLIWKNNIGQVSIELDMGHGRRQEMTVTPVQAAVIMKFQEKDTWQLQELSQSLKMCSFALRKKLLFWKMQGLIREVEKEKSGTAAVSATHVASGNAENRQQQQQQEDDIGDTYTLVRDAEAMAKGHAVYEDEEEVDKSAQSKRTLKENEITLYWNYTQNMLRSCGCLPLDRIHSWLKLYANPDITLEQVKHLLEGKTKELLLKYNAGLYRLNK